MRSTRFGILGLTVVLAVAAAVPALASGHIFQANLTTSAEVTEVVGSNATGHAKFTVTSEGIEFELKANRLSGPAWGAHIHGPAAAGSNAGIIAKLCGLPPGGAVGECSTDDNGKLRVSGVITEENLNGVTFEQLLEYMESGMTYVNVHTELNNPGEVRGQVR